MAVSPTPTEEAAAVVEFRALQESGALPTRDATGQVVPGKEPASVKSPDVTPPDGKTATVYERPGLPIKTIVGPNVSGLEQTIDPELMPKATHQILDLTGAGVDGQVAVDILAGKIPISAEQFAKAGAMKRAFMADQNWVDAYHAGDPIAVGNMWVVNAVLTAGVTKKA